MLRTWPWLRGPAFLVKEKALGRLFEGAKGSQPADFCIATAQRAMLMGSVKHDSAAARAAIQAAPTYLNSLRVTSATGS
jgi:hypothetical protein